MSRCAGLLAAGLFFTLVSATGRVHALCTEARAIPLPGGASEKVREAIASTPARPRMTRDRVPETTEAWLAFIAARQEKRLKIVAALTSKLGLSIATQTLGGVVSYWVRPDVEDPEMTGRVFFYLHGGAYLFNSGEAGLVEPAVIAGRLRMPVVSVDYRMPPLHPFPAALDDAVAAYRDLLQRHPAQAIIVGGTSAGGGLALALIHRLRQLGVELPAAVYGGTPWSDLNKVGDSYFINHCVDRLLLSYDGFLEIAAEMYAGGHALDDPLLSPVNGDFAGFPPTLLITGTRDLFLSNSVRVHRNLRAAGVEADLLVFEGMSHADYLAVPGSPEQDLTYAELRRFVRDHLEAGPAHRERPGHGPRRHFY